MQLAVTGKPCDLCDCFRTAAVNAKQPGHDRTPPERAVLRIVLPCREILYRLLLMIRILRLLVIQRNAILCAGLFCLGFSAASMADEPTQVMTGIDVLQARQFAPLEGARVALITNHTGVDSNGRSTASILHAAPNVTLVALFSPEHGFKGQLDLPEIGNVTDSKTGMTVYSLYGETRTPTAEMLRGVDTIVFDIQDIGTRFYTYVSTMGNAMQAAAQYKLRFIVLDRPNPINGIIVSGPVLDEGKLSFVGFHRLPVRHGMTIGELARMFQNDLELDIALEVVPLQGWRRSHRACMDQSLAEHAQPQCGHSVSRHRAARNH